MGFLSSILDFSKLLNKECHKEIPLFNKVKQVWINFLSNNDFVEDYYGLAYPLTNNNNYTFNKFESAQDFSDKINENLIFLNESNILDINNSEIKLLKNDENIDVEINLNYNQKLSQERNQLIKDKNINNILFIYIDSLSRSHFFRKMKLVTIFLEKFYKSKSNETNYESFQFMKYQTFKRDYYESSLQWWRCHAKRICHRTKCKYMF